MALEIGAPDVEQALRLSLEGDLGFQGQLTSYSTHSVHAFAAKFPPQLPKTFIEALTSPGDTILDPMVGSGTAVLEAALLGRRAVGIDIDPLALKISQAKTCSTEPEEALLYAEGIADWARSAVAEPTVFRLRELFLEHYSESARRFFSYWFKQPTIWELSALIQGIENVAPAKLRPFFEVVFSSIIVTKSGGVSRARDLAHSRPHLDTSKPVANAIDAFWDKARRIAAAVAGLPRDILRPLIVAGDCRLLPVEPACVDLIVTSPPYANAIDYVRAHKFSLIWLGYRPEALSRKRREYIGAEVDRHGEISSPIARTTIQAIARVDPRRAKIVATYFTDMRACLKEMLRVLRPGKPAVIVVGASTIRGIKVKTPLALAEIAEGLGFKVVAVQPRPIDRDRRLMPISRDGNSGGIEARMHEEHVIGLLKPGRGTS
jgi:DNA modification methylase